MNSVKAILMSALAGAGVPLLLATPAGALSFVDGNIWDIPSQLQLPNLGESIEGLGQTVLEQINQVDDTVSSVINDTLKQSIDNALGGIEIENPLEALEQHIARANDRLREALEQEIGAVVGTEAVQNPLDVRRGAASHGGVLTGNPEIAQQDIADQIDREIARSLSAEVVGQAGQQRLAREAEDSTALVLNSVAGAQGAQTLAEQAQGLSVTQDIVKQSAQIDAQIAGLLSNQTQLQAEENITLLQMQELQGAMATIAANTSEGVDEINRQNRVERRFNALSSARSSFYIPGLYPEGGQ